jgi:nitrate/TMAO reductase-like tetraheme cytochrome c subunit
MTGVSALVNPPKGGSRSMKRWLLIAAIAVLAVLLMLVVLAFAYTSQPSFCASCHTISPFEKTWQTSSHKAVDVTCIDCHFEPGAVGYLKGKTYSFIKLAQWAFGQTDKKPEAARTIVAGACRHCHPDPKATFMPHAFHTEVANLDCTECHSGVVHGALVGPEKPQAAADPAFCNKCHTGDIAPILFLPIEPAGREHPGAPKLDVNVWRNNHWRLANQGATIDGVAYDKIQPETCAACHQDPTVAKACKGCHFARVPEFAASPKAERASFVPMLLFFYLFGLFMVAVVLRGKDKERFFSSRALRVITILVLISDAYVVYLILSDVLVAKTGQHEIGPTTVWISYLLLSIAMVAFLLFEGSLLPNPLRPVRLPKTGDDSFLVPKPIRRLGVRRSEEASAETGGTTPPGDVTPPATPNPPEDPGA